MNKKITVPVAGLALLAALAGCHSGNSAAVSSESAKAHALVTSSAGQQAEAAGKDLAQTCLPAKDLNRSYLVGLAVNLSEAKALAAKCDIPKGNIEPFAKAVLSSVSTAYLSGKFSTDAQRDSWADKQFPQIVVTYQGKK
jgi:hypothetical protein